MNFCDFMNFLRFYELFLCLVHIHAKNIFCPEKNNFCPQHKRHYPLFSLANMNFQPQKYIFVQHKRYIIQDNFNIVPKNKYFLGQLAFGIKCKNSNAMNFLKLFKDLVNFKIFHNFLENSLNFLIFFLKRLKYDSLGLETFSVLFKCSFQHLYFQ